MNTLLSNATLFELDPNLVDDSGRIGFFHPDKATALGRLMAVDGQRDPIKVVKSAKNAALPWRLVVGMHRLHGARIEGIAVHAIEVSGRPEALADLEASENLHRRPLSPLERAKFTAALVQAARDRIAREHGDLSHQRLGAKLRWERVKAHESTPADALTDEVNDTCATMAQAYGWEETVGEALGMSRRSIHRDLELFRLIIEPFPALAEGLSRHPVVGENAAQLRAIAQVREENHRRKVIDALLADNELSADDARTRLGVGKVALATEPPSYSKFTSQITSGWDRLNLGQRRQFVPTLAAMLSTPDLKKAMRDKLNEDLGGTVEVAIAPETDDVVSTAFDVISALAVGDPVDDDQIEAARSKLQRFLLVSYRGAADAG